MSSARVLLFLSLGVLSSGHPVADTITLLQNLDAQITEEGKTEALTYQKFEYWCTNTKKDLEIAITEGKARIEELTDEIDSLQRDIEVAGEEISALTQQLQDIGTEQAKAQTDRDYAANIYSQERTALEQTISAVEQALDALVQESVNLSLRQQRVRAVLSLVGTGISSHQRSELHEFSTPQRPELKAAGDYEAHVKDYSFKSSSVIELLKKLKTKFEGELLATNKAETNAINAFALSNAARGNLETAVTSSKAAHQSEHDSASGQLATAQSDLIQVQGDLTADETTLGDTSKSCHVKKTEWEERSEIRQSEQEAIKAAIEILAKVAGVRTAPPSNPTMPTSPVSFIQLERPDTERAVELLRKEAKLAHSKTIEQLAQQVASHLGGPFDEVVNVIQKMIFRLMNEQKEEDDHKNWCDKELSKTTSSRDDKSAKIAELTVKIDATSATAANLLTEINEANHMVFNIVKHMQEATEIRDISKKENGIATKDAQKAQTAIANAIAVLEDFYKSTGMIAKESWEFLQRNDPAPATWGASYQGVADPANQPGGIVTVLERVAADFAKMESDTSAQEAYDQMAYNEDMKSSSIEKARRSKESEMKTQERKRLLDDQQSLESTRKGVKGEFEATEQYLKDLEPACVVGTSTYVDRKAARSQEVEALKEAQALLQDAFNNSTNDTPDKTFLQIRRHE